jgi:hypothetical protein
MRLRITLTGECLIKRSVVRQHGDQHCSVLMSDKKPGGSHEFWGLPGIRL